MLFSCIFLYSCVLSPKNSCFCPPKCPRDKKGQKNTSLECLGHKRWTKLIFWTLLIIIVKSFYLVAIQYVSLRLMLKIINLYKIANILIINILTNCYFPMQNLPKILFKTSLLLISPVMLPR